MNSIKEIEAKLNGKERVLIIPSGTEPLIRVMFEDENQEEVDKIVHNLSDLILGCIYI